LLQIEPDKHERVIERLAGSFALGSITSFEYPLELSGADAALLLQMTPSARHVTPEAFATLAAAKRVLVTAGFALLAFTKRE
jgi:23S rRNA (guanine745-N1)-methyltransferase